MIGLYSLNCSLREYNKLIWGIYVNVFPFDLKWMD